MALTERLLQIVNLCLWCVLVGYYWADIAGEWIPRICLPMIVVLGLVYFYRRWREYKAWRAARGS